MRKPHSLGSETNIITHLASGCWGFKNPMSHPAFFENGTPPKMRIK